MFYRIPSHPVLNAHSDREIERAVRSLIESNAIKYPDLDQLSAAARDLYDSEDENGSDCHIIGDTFYFANNGPACIHVNLISAAVQDEEIGAWV